ncbi:hypothetical protein C8F01DRAFT_1261250 [Mycena amicta]|nr:hypothetical protein C8F01DRAFT_1261250 [Mycena amicta]
MQDPQSPEAEVAEFLAFAQHLQYWKSGGKVYISDLQGTVSLLTDPQVMTSPDIPNSAQLFGDGNVPEAFLAFPKQHQCNKFCRWFRVPQFNALAAYAVMSSDQNPA